MASYDDKFSRSEPGADASALPPSATRSSGQSRRGLRWAVGVLVVLLAVAGGIGIGRLVASRLQAPIVFAEGGCVSLGERQATAVACDAAGADARIGAIVDDGAACPAAPLGTLDLGDRGFACLVPRDG